MSERKIVTRDGFADAITERYARFESAAIFDALPATPPASGDVEAAYALALRQIEDDGETINRLRRALRVATHSPHDQDGEPNEGFPVCSVCGAVQTDPPASGDVEAAWERVKTRMRRAISPHGFMHESTEAERGLLDEVLLSMLQIVDDSRQSIEAAIRAEADGTLDVERLARAFAAFYTSHDEGGVSNARSWKPEAKGIAAEYALAAIDALIEEAADKP